MSSDMKKEYVCIHKCRKTFKLGLVMQIVTLDVWEAETGIMSSKLDIKILSPAATKRAASVSQW